MKIIVCLKEVVDPSLSLDAGLRHNMIFGAGVPLRLDPSDSAALALALDLKSSMEKSLEITLLSIGPARVESYLRNGFALGADKIVRIWENGFTRLSSFLKVRLLAAAVSMFGADIIFTGTRSLDTASGVVGPMLAARLSLPCVADVGSLTLDPKGEIITATRHIGRGEREKVECPVPAVITIRGEGKLPYAPLDRFVESRRIDVPVLSLFDLGIPAAEFENEPARFGGQDYPRPRPVKVPPLDASLPAFDRILQLLQGGISRRRKIMLEGNSDEQAERIFRLLLEDGVLKVSHKV